MLKHGWIKTPAGRIRCERPHSSARNYPEQKFLFYFTSVFEEAPQLPTLIIWLWTHHPTGKNVFVILTQMLSLALQNNVSFSQIYRLIYPFHRISNNSDLVTTLCWWYYEKTYRDYAAIIWNYPLKRGDLIWTQSKFNDGHFRYTLRHFLFRTPECFISMKKACSVFYTLPTHTPRNRPYSSSNIKAARLPARPHTVEYSSLLRRRPTSAKPRIPLIFHSTSSFLSWHSRKRSGSIRLVGLSSATFSRCAESLQHRDPFRCLQECVLLPDRRAFILYIHNLRV